MIKAESGKQALAAAREKQFNSVILDIEMPGMDGFEVCRKMRETLDVPIIFLSSRRDLMDKLKCFELGGDDYVTKPFHFTELEARVEANLRSLKMPNNYRKHQKLFVGA